MLAVFLAALLCLVPPISAETLVDSVLLTPSQQDWYPEMGMGTRQVPGFHFAQIDQDSRPQVEPERQSRQRRKHLEQLRLFKLLELLDLSPEQESDFIVAFRQHRKAQQKLHSVRADIVDRLALGLKEKSLPPDEVYLLVGKLEKNSQEHLKQNQEFLGQVRGILDVWQYGKLAVFKDRFEYELLEAVKTFHDRPGRGMGREEHYGR